MIILLYKKLLTENFRLQAHVALRKSKAFFLKGNQFYCPCCRKSSSKFLKKGNGIEFRQNAVCPNCGSLERTRLLYLYLKNETSIFEGNPRILHFAPESALKQKFMNNKNYIDVDINPNFARHKMDITNITFPNNYFDFIICSHVLGHIPDEKKAISELYRVLKPKGTLLLLSLLNPNLDTTFEDPERINTPAERLKSYGEKDLERIYGGDFSKRIDSPAVSIQEIDYRNHFILEERLKMSLGDGKREIIYKVVKI